MSELVCSNSLRSNELTNAAETLKKCAFLGSLLIEKAVENSVPAGAAHVVDKNFSCVVTCAI
ncbi:MAG: hypothetical protein L5655_00500 [Thermosediminibacteraceae bacterium]|nr:hypothetical protein [Thermosediminibacteraceae bacterium]